MKNLKIEPTMKSFFSPRVLQTSRILAKRAAGHSSRPTVLKAGFLPTPVVLALGLTGAAVGGYYFFDARSAFHEYVLCPLIRTFTDGEQGHKLGILFMKLGVSPRLYNEYNTDQTDILGVNVFGTRLRTPIGLAAGLDKDGEAIEASFVQLRIFLRRNWIYHSIAPTR